MYQVSKELNVRNTGRKGDSIGGWCCIRHIFCIMYILYASLYSLSPRINIFAIIIDIKQHLFKIYHLIHLDINIHPWKYHI